MSIIGKAERRKEKSEVHPFNKIEIDILAFDE